jgi:hypothetical protein
MPTDTQPDTTAKVAPQAQKTQQTTTATTQEPTATQQRRRSVRV